MFVLMAASMALASAAPEMAPLGADVMAQASASALTAPEGFVRGKELGHFTTALGEAQAFETDLRQGGFTRTFVVLIRPSQAGHDAVSVMLTSDAEVGRIARAKGKTPPLFLDLYTCTRHVTLGLLDHRPAYEEFRDLVISKLADPTSGISSTEAHGGSGCPFGDFVFPGIAALR